MRKPFTWMLPPVLALAAATAPSRATAVELEGMRLADSTEVAGRNLKLNGAGIGSRMIFKVYAISLYLLERQTSAESVLRADGPRRLVIRMLRDVSGADFRQAMLESLGSDGEKLEISNGMLQIGSRIAEQPRGLKKGDVLTLDWVPSLGTVVELNQRPMLAPIPDAGLYGALLGIWLGTRPTDPALKDKLLGNFGARPTGS